MIEAITEYVRSLHIEGIDQNVFAYNLKVDEGAVFVASALGVDPEIPKMYRGSFQLVVRGRDISSTQSIAKKISDALDYNERISKGLAPDIGVHPYVVKYIRPRHLPLLYPRSDGDLYEASVNFDICFMASI